MNPDVLRGRIITLVVHHLGNSRCLSINCESSWSRRRLTQSTVSGLSHCRLSAHVSNVSNNVELAGLHPLYCSGNKRALHIQLVRVFDRESRCRVG